MNFIQLFILESSSTVVANTGFLLKYLKIIKLSCLLKFTDSNIPLYISYLHEKSANDAPVLMYFYTIDHNTSNSFQNALISCDLADSY